jgi:hypothetical protein
MKPAASPSDAALKRAPSSSDVPSPRAVIVGCSRGMSADSVPWLTEQMRTSKPIASRRP